MEEILASSDDEFSDSDDEGNFMGYTGILRDTTMELNWYMSQIMANKISLNVDYN